MAHEDQNDLNRIWQDQPAEEVSMRLDDIRKRARKMGTTVGRRNLIEFAAAAIVLVLIGVRGTRETNVTALIGGGLMALAVLYVVYHLHRFGSVRSMPSDLALKDCLDFHRAELMRQRDLGRSVWWWYLLPFVPGYALIMIGAAIERPDRRLFALGSSVVFIVLFILVGKLNERGARKLQRIIDGLDQARG